MNRRSALNLLKQLYEPSNTPPPQAQAESYQVSNRDRASKDMLPKLLDFDKVLLADMDTNGVTMHVLSLVMPGVQMLERTQANELAKLSNDRLSWHSGTASTKLGLLILCGLSTTLFSPLHRQ
jgi:hypothetical protein